MAEGSGPESPRPGRWWQTLPGVVTAVAGLLTAAAGLLLALNQTGLLHAARGPTPSAPASPGPGPQAVLPQSPSQPSAAPASPATAPAQTQTQIQAVSFAPGAKVTLGNNRGRGTYELLAAGFERRTDAVGTLTLHIRLTNAGPADIGFWTDSFRLVVDGVPAAPTSRLNSSVEARAAKEADVAFDLPRAARSLELRISSGDEDGAIPLTLGRPR